VTGPFEDPEVNDEGQGIPLFMRPFGSRLNDSVCSSGAVSDVCCPFTPREGPLGIPVDPLTMVRDLDCVELRARASEGSDASAGLPQSLLRFVREDEPHLVKAEVVGAPTAHRRDCDVVLGEQTLGELVGG
jgi:hypothetical protein